MSRRGPAVALSGLLLCGSALLPGAAGADDAKVCTQLANIFYVVARYEERGESKADQIVWVRESFGNADSPAHTALLDRAVDYVYAHEGTPRQIRKIARESCRVNDRGQAILRLPDP